MVERLEATHKAARVRLLSAGRTDVGRVRDHNEDQILLAPELSLYVVADGMGGHSTGEVASALVIASMRNFFEATRTQALVSELPEDAELTEPALRLAMAIRKANADLHEISTSHKRHKGMGSTVVAVLLAGEAVHVAHVGDSRAYRVRDGRIVQLTRDHSLVNEALALRPDLSPEAIARLPHNVITRALGMRGTVKVDLQQARPEPGDVLLLCSDGLSGMVDDETVLDVFSMTENLDEACELLVTLANDNGGKDNISVVLMRFEAADEEPAPPSVWRGIDVRSLKGRLVVTESDDVVIAAEEAFIEDPLAELAGVLAEQDIARLQQGETLQLSVPKCRKCGTELLEDNAFCTECGTPVAE
jgi:PPM family protein phosphatase